MSNVMHLSPTLRVATLADLPAVSELAEDLAALHHQAWPTVFAPASGSSRDDAHWQESITGDGRVTFVAELDGRNAGFVTLACITETHSLFQPVRFARVNSVCVATWARGKGIGRALMQEAEAWAGAQRASEIRLVVWAFNEPALRMYEELGYTVRSHTLGKVLGGAGA
ncbi:GNAT family N-acetyltransferase [Piscinibacter sp. XHJ-5]|uniref:GNAT family N-acetyltransferase n=1 Tax=Piscinibacter sp. XHJ-5 TaxID=3037797 RepID=UPI002453613D|nr:GNAT family N-acetyltransferase [Piscinibacter sp. XHJ-5]